VPRCQKLQWQLNPVWHRMLDSCTHYDDSGHQRVKLLYQLYYICGWQWVYVVSYLSFACRVVKQWQSCCSLSSVEYETCGVRYVQSVLHIQEVNQTMSLTTSPLIWCWNIGRLTMISYPSFGFRYHSFTLFHMYNTSRCVIYFVSCCKIFSTFVVQYTFYIID